MAFLHVRAAGDPRGVIGGAELGRVGRPVDQHVRAVAAGPARVRLGRVSDHDLRHLAERAARSGFHGHPGAGIGTQIFHLIMPAIADRIVLFGYIMRMARAGTIAALDADYTRTAVLKGLPTQDGHPPPRAAKRAAADDHGRGHPGRLPDRRPGGGGEPVPLQRHRLADRSRPRQDKDFPMLEAGVLTIGVVYLDRNAASPTSSTRCSTRGCGWAVTSEHGAADPAAVRTRRLGRRRRRPDPARAVARSFGSPRRFMVGRAILIFWVVCALFGYRIVPHGPYAQDLLHTDTPPDGHALVRHRPARPRRVLARDRRRSRRADRRALATLLGTILGTSSA